MLLLVLFIFIGGRFISDTALLSVSAMLLGSLSCYLLNFKKFQGMDLRKILGSLNNGITSIGSLSAVCGFGAVVQGLCGPFQYCGGRYFLGNEPLSGGFC